MKVYLKNILTSLIILLTVNASLPAVAAQRSKKMPRDKEKLFWLTRVDKTARWPAGQKPLDETDPQNIIKGIDYLLTLRGNKNSARFCGATRFDVNSPDVPCTVEVAALFYISYLFYQKWDHAHGVALIDKEFKLNRPQAIRKAYYYYQAWFEKVKDIGLEQARQRNLDPLKGTDVRWY